eukprot:gene8156-5872_t
MFTRLSLQSTSVVRSAIGSVRHGSSISVILLEKVGTVGQAGSVVSVKRGYARNFLIPRKMAAYATFENRAKHAALIETAKTAQKSD